jgi:hypothetical protein
MIGSNGLCDPSLSFTYDCYDTIDKQFRRTQLLGVTNYTTILYSRQIFTRNSKIQIIHEQEV